MEEAMLRGLSSGGWTEHRFLGHKELEADSKRPTGAKSFSRDGQTFPRILAPMMIMHVLYSIVNMFVLPPQREKK